MFIIQALMLMLFTVQDVMCIMCIMCPPSVFCSLFSIHWRHIIVTEWVMDFRTQKLWGVSVPWESVVGAGFRRPCTHVLSLKHPAQTTQTERRGTRASSSLETPVPLPHCTFCLGTVVQVSSVLSFGSGLLCTVRIKSQTMKAVAVLGALLAVVCQVS